MNTELKSFSYLDCNDSYNVKDKIVLFRMNDITGEKTESKETYRIMKDNVEFKNISFPGIYTITSENGELVKYISITTKIKTIHAKF